ncbi:nucleolar complex protein 3 homolog isoform X2 [Glandiceps talaboti]
MKQKKGSKKVRQRSGISTRKPIPAKFLKRGFISLDGHHDVGNRGDDGEEDEEIPLEEEDLEFFGGVDTSKLSSLLNLSTSTSTSSRKPRKRKLPEGQEKEESFEQEPRKGFVEEAAKKMKPLLPIKNKKGIELQWAEEGASSAKKPKSVEKKLEKKEEVEDKVDDNDKEVEVKVKEKLPALSTVELFARRQNKLAEKKRHIASLASSVVEDPENSTQKLKQLRLMLDEKDPDVFITVRKLVMVSLMEIFKDIAPSYRIRELSDTERSQQVSKDVRRVRDFEESLLKNYRIYLEKLERAIKGYKKRKYAQKNDEDSEKLAPKAIHSLKETAAQCLASLMTSLAHFNYRSNIISVFVPLVVDKNQQISDICCTAVRQLFKEDPLGEASFDAVKVITKMIKSRNFHVKSKVLDSFLSLKIKDIDLSAEDDNKKKFMTKKEKMKKLSRMQRKKSKREDKLEKELMETAATESKKKKQYLQTEIIKMVFAIYFRILKKAETSVLLPSVLEGLAKYAHLINIDFFDDLVQVLHSLIDSGELSNRECLHCILTTFRILSGQGQALNIDPSKFYTHLYKILFELHTEENSKDIPIALECLEVMINKRKKQVTLQRVLSFAKKLCTLALQVLPHETLACLAAVKSFLQMHTKCDILMDNDNTGSGVYLPQLEEPEHCNTHNTTLWEFYLLQRHYHPSVRWYSGRLCQGAATQTATVSSDKLFRKSPQTLLSEFDPADMIFNPVIARPTQKSKKKVHASEKPYLQLQIQEAVNVALDETTKISELSAIDYFKTIPNLKLLSTKKVKRSKTNKIKATRKVISKSSKVVKRRRK